jgi:hypothetical protein
LSNQETIGDLILCDKTCSGQGRIAVGVCFGAPGGCVKTGACHLVMACHGK